MNISPPDPMRDYVQGQDEERWLRDLDASIAAGMIEMKAGGGIDLDLACDDLIAEIDTMTGDRRP